MIVKRDQLKPEFRPIIVVLESKEEAQVICELLYMSHFETPDVHFGICCKFTPEQIKELYRQRRNMYDKFKEVCVREELE